MAVEQEIGHLLTAIKAGIFTTTTKAELEKLEAERVRLLNSLDDSAKGLRKIAAFLPNAEARYRQLVLNLERLPQRYIAQARQELATLLDGAIRLLPTAAGYLEAPLRGRYDGLVTLAAGRELNNLVAGDRFSFHFESKIRITLI
jgi:hypothetical protein